MDGENCTFLNHVLSKYSIHIKGDYLFHIFICITITKYSIMGQLVVVCTVILVRDRSLELKERKYA